MTPAEATGTGPHLSWPGALRIAVSRRSLKRTLVAAFLVGTILTAVNMGGTLVANGLTVVATVKIALTYLVPWGNATFGIAVGQRHRAAADAKPCRTPTLIAQDNTS